MECKCKQFITGLWLYLELIETLWNVNWTYQDDKGQWHIELIETLWNVNQEGEKYIKVFARGARINRNIVECKYGSTFSKR